MSHDVTALKLESLDVGQLILGVLRASRLVALSALFLLRRSSGFVALS